MALRYKMYEKEVRFYNELAAQTNVRTPRVIYADYDPETENVALLMEYMEGWTSPDQLTGASHNQTVAAIKQLTAINAPFWDRTAELPWLPTMQTDYMQLMIPDMQACRDIFWERFGDALPISEQDYALIIDQWPAILDGLCGTLTFPTTTIGWRICSFPRRKQVAVIDWQPLARCARWDLAYLAPTF